MKEIREIFETVSTYCGMMFLDAKMPRCEDAKSITKAAMLLGSEAAKSVMENTEPILAPMAGEESSSLRTVVSIRNAGAGESQNEIIQSYPSPEFLNSLPFIKKFYPAPRCGEGKVTEVAHDNNLNSSETDHASIPLGIFASKSVSLSDWQIRPTALKRAAFTLAEVLITLGIIGVVAAITLPTLIQNYQKQVWVNQLKKAYSSLNNGVRQMIVDQGCSDVTCTNFWDDGYVVIEPSLNDNFVKSFTKTFKLSNVQELTENSIYAYPLRTIANDDEDEESFYYDYMVGVGGTSPDGMIMFLGATYGGYLIMVDINGLKNPNQFGRDIFIFQISSKGLVVPTYSKDSPSGNWQTEEERVQDVNEECNPSISASIGASCGEKIIMDGWKMNY